MNISNDLHIEDNLTRLDFSTTIITVENAKTISNYINSNKILTYLKLNNCQIGSHGIEALAKSLKTSAIEVLSLNNNFFGNNGISFLCNALMHENNKISYLFLVLCGIEENGAKLLGKVLACNNTLLHLNLDNNPIGDSGASALFTGLKVNSALLSIMLTNTRLGDASAFKVKNYFKKKSTPILSLGLVNNQFTQTGLEELRQTYEDILVKSVLYSPITSGITLFTNLEAAQPLHIIQSKIAGYALSITPENTNAIIPFISRPMIAFSLLNPSQINSFLTKAQEMINEYKQAEQQDISFITTHLVFQKVIFENGKIPDFVLKFKKVKHLHFTICQLRG